MEEVDSELVRIRPELLSGLLHFFIKEIHMKFKIDISGLKRLQRNAQALSGTHQIKLTELFDGPFMRSKTRFSSFEQMVTESGIEDFGAATDIDKDEMIRKLTQFSTWQEFLNTAGAEYAKRQLFK